MEQSEEIGRRRIVDVPERRDDTSRTRAKKSTGDAVDAFGAAAFAAAGTAGGQHDQWSQSQMCTGDLGCGERGRFPGW